MERTAGAVPAHVARVAHAARAEALAAAAALVGAHVCGVGTAVRVTQRGAAATPPSSASAPSEQSSPWKPGEHTHCAFKHRPLPEQSLGQPTARVPSGRTLALSPAPTACTHLRHPAPAHKRRLPIPQSSGNGSRPCTRRAHCSSAGTEVAAPARLSECLPPARAAARPRMLLTHMRTITRRRRRARSSSGAAGRGQAVQQRQRAAQVCDVSP